MSNLTQDQIALGAFLKDKEDKMAAWVAEDPGNRFGCTAVSCPEFWAGYNVFSIADYERHALIGDIFDYHKSLHGIKPRWLNTDEMSMEELDHYMGCLIEEDRYQEEQRLKYAEDREVDPLEGLPTEWEEKGFSNGLVF